jgi:hypothetical protein
MFPLNEAPQGLAALMQKFRRGEAIKGFIREQLVAGATVALACVRVHHPHIDLEVIGRGLPPQPDGEKTPMIPHYDAASGPAANIIRLVESETDEMLGRLGRHL